MITWFGIRSIGWVARRRARRLWRRPDPAGPRFGGRLPIRLGSRPTRLTVALLAGLGIGLVTGSVAGAAVAGIYGGWFARSWSHRQAQRAAAGRRAASLDLLAGAAADLRASQQPGLLALPDPQLDSAVRMAQTLAERTGAPLADLLDRIEAEHRAGSRAEANSRAQAAGSRATTTMLALLPLGGIALGYLVGADPLRMLLHTPLGAACLAGATALQLAGLAWAEALTAQPGRPRPSAGPSARRRLRRIGPRRGRTDRLGVTRVAAGLAGLLVWAVLPNWWGAGIGLLAALALERAVRRMEPAEVRAERLRATADLPIAADLLAAALKAGLPVDAAALAVGAVLGGPLGARLGRTGRALRLGAGPGQAWRQLADLPAAGRVISAAERSATSGAALSGALARCASEARADALAAEQERAQRAAVLIVLPLGLCFLPAFVLAGLAPVILAVLGEVL